jgi:hypothetical protein
MNKFDKVIMLEVLKSNKTIDIDTLYNMGKLCVNASLPIGEYMHYKMCIIEKCKLIRDRHCPKLLVLENPKSWNRLAKNYKIERIERLGRLE